MTIFVPLLCGLLFAPLIMRLLITAKSRQTINKHVAEHAHKQGTPTMGGFIILIPLFVGMAPQMIGGENPAAVWPMAALLFGYTLIGFADDYLVARLNPKRRGLDWITKLVLQAVVMAVCGWLGGMGVLQTLFAAFFVLLFSNAYNFSDGIDMLAGSLGLFMALLWVALLAGFTGPLLLESGMQEHSSALFAHQKVFTVLAASFPAFLIWNAHPAKVFMGDVGSLPIGAVFGWSIATVLWQAPSYPENGAMLVWLKAFVFSIPMLLELVPAALQVISARLTGKRLFKFKTPIHHAFQQAGWSEARIVWLFVAVQILFGGLAWSISLPSEFGPR